MNQPTGIPTQGPQTPTLPRQLLWQTLTLAVLVVLIAPASAAYVGGNSLQGKMPLDASPRQAAADLTTAPHPGSGGLCLRLTAECFVAPNSVVSRISESPNLVRGAESAGKSVQDSIDKLTGQLARGNLNPGIGTRPIGNGISEARALDGARVYFRQLRDGTIEILGKSNKANQSRVIAEILRLFGG